MLNRAPIRLRLTLWYLLLLAVILAAFATGVYLLLRHTLYQNLNESIVNRTVEVLNVIQFEDGRPHLSGRLSSTNPEKDGYFVRVFDVTGSATLSDSASVAAVPLDANAVADALAGETTYRSAGILGDDDRVRVRTTPITRDRTIVGALEVGQPEDDISETLFTLLLVMGIAYPATLAVAGLGGVFLAGRALSPIDRITNAARETPVDDLGQRLNLHLPDDEVGRLARTFDEMLARLDDAFRRQRQFTADASHELRTPLTVIKGQIDVSLLFEREPEEYRHVLHAVNEEVDRLIRLAGSLLTLARADAGKIAPVFELINVPELVAGVLEQVRPTAAAIGSSPATIQADEDLLLQLMLNLLDNAVKYTPSGGRIDVHWEMTGNHVELRVQDTGIGISSEHLPNLFDRFYRVDQGRTRAEGGVGLGLAISRWIAEVHGGSIQADSVSGEGTTFVVQLPTSQ